MILKFIKSIVPLLLLSLACLSQTPNYNLTNSNERTTFGYQGPLTSNGYQVKNFADTFVLNAQPYLKGIPGLLVRVGNQLYYRNEQLTGWIPISFTDIPSNFDFVDSMVVYSNNTICQWKKGSPTCYTLSTGGTNIFTGIDSITANLRSICEWKNGIPNCHTLLAPGIDSVTLTADTLLCQWSSGIPGCYIIHGNVVQTGPTDSLKVTGNNYCWYFSGVPTCITINNVGKYYDATSLNFDSTKYIHYNNGVPIDSITTLIKPVIGDTCILIRDSSNGKTYFYLNPNCTGSGGLISNIKWSVLDSLSTPAVSPIIGSIYLVGTSPTGLFIGHANQIANYDTIGVYSFQSPSMGDLLYNAATQQVDQWNGVSWVRVTVNDYVHITGTETVIGKKTFLDTLLLSGAKGIKLYSTPFANVNFLETVTQGTSFPWLSIKGNAAGSSIVMGANNPGSASDELRIAADYTDSIWTGTYRPLIIDTYDYLKLRAKRGSGNDTAISFVTSGNLFNYVGHFSNAGKFTLNKYGSSSSFITADTTNNKPTVMDALGNVGRMSYWPGSGGGGSGWSLTGNAGTDPTVNFIGTTDAQPLYLRVNNDTVAKFGLLLGNTSIGYNSVASNYYSTAIGQSSNASGENSIAIGEINIASDYGAVAIGTQDTSSGHGAVSIGTANNSTGFISTAIGNANISAKDFSTAIGSTNTANAVNSVALGSGLKSKSYSGVAVGHFNDSSDATDPASFNLLNRAFEVGIGSSNETRANGMTILFNGNVGIGTTAPDSAFTNQLGLWSKRGVRFSGLSLTGFDTTTNKPVVINSSGTLSKMNWPAAGSTGVTSVTGTTNRITSTGGTTPVMDISSSYAGQSSITTLGTITTGVWNGTAITNANLANSSITINGTSASLGASVTVTAAAGTLTGATLSSGVTASSLTSVGTIVTGVWNGTAIANANLANSAVTINGTSISLGTSGTVTAAGSTLTGSSLASGITTSSLTSFGSSPTLVTPNIGVANGTSLVMGGTLAASAILDLQSTTKGALFPRMTTTQRDAISSPATGLMLFNTTKGNVEKYNGNEWEQVGASLTKSVEAANLAGSPMIAETYGLVGSVSIIGSTSLGSGSPGYNAIKIEKRTTLTGLAFFLVTTGSFTPNNTNSVGLFSYNSSTGGMTKIAESANSSSIYTGSANSWVQVPFTSTVTVAPGIYITAVCYSSSSQTTAPAIGRGNLLISGNINSPNTTNSFKFYSFRTGQTSLPSTENMSNLTANTSPFYIYAY